jgi:ribosomal protein S12 methylthiotransferase
MKFHLISLGCSKNTADSEQLANQLVNMGCQWSSSPTEADLILINTCGFIKDAKTESLKTIFEASQFKNKSPRTKLCVFGCLVKRYYKEIKEQVPEIDYLYTFINEDNMRELIRAPISGQIISDQCKSWRFFTPPHIGILKIAEGCSNRCAYCAIPDIRGPFHSRPEKEILDDARKLVDSGAIELSVVAQDITRFGTDISSGNCRLPELLYKLGRIEGLSWIRLHYMHPKGLTTDLIDRIFTLPKVLPYFDIPFQHFSDRMLRLMKRNTSPGHIVKLIGHIRKKFRLSAIRTTFIVGFPGENEEDFQTLRDFIEMHPIDRVGAFAYSTEENTPAAMIIPKVPTKVKLQRLDRLMTLQQLLAQERNRKLIGKTTDLIIDSCDKNEALGRTFWDSYEIDNLTRINHSPTPLKPGQIIRARIVDADAYDFKAIPL